MFLFYLFALHIGFTLCSPHKVFFSSLKTCALKLLIVFCHSGQTRKDLSTVEDPFDAPTYNIPEKPVTFTEGASYSIIILAGLGVAAAAAYAVFKELIFEPKE
jgi:import inner membrane translocase subunit TIM21